MRYRTVNNFDMIFEGRESFPNVALHPALEINSRVGPVVRLASGRDRLTDFAGGQFRVILPLAATPFHEVARSHRFSLTGDVVNHELTQPAEAAADDDVANIFRR